MSATDAARTPSESDGSLSLLNLVVVLVRHLRLIVGTTALGGLLITGYAFLTMYLPSSNPFNLLPMTYRAEAKVLILDRNASRLSHLNLAFADAQDTVRQMVIRNTLGGRVVSGATLAQELLGGRTIQDQIIDEFRFMERYGFTEQPRTRSRSLIEHSLSYEHDAASSVLSIAYDDEDADFAAAVLKRTLELLEGRFHALSMETVLLKKQHLEDRLAAAVADREAAQERFVSFQEARGAGLIELPGGTTGFSQLHTIQLLSDYTGRLLSKEVEMHSKRGLLPTNDPSLVQLRSEIRILRQLLAELQGGFSFFSAQAIPRDELPGVMAEYVNLRRDLKTQEDNYLNLRGQYELTRLTETDPSRTFQIIEAVEVPESKHKPRRLGVSVVGALMALGLAVVIVFFMEYMGRVRADPIEALKLAGVRNRLGLIGPSRDAK